MKRLCSCPATSACFTRLDGSHRMEQTHGMILPANHPLRQKLNDEVHARPPEELNAPCSIS
ncbi:MAG TPA: DUF3422 family protein, partial [Rhodomicrobium sp.]|nr:DUF3422 family protein [Rhodomicrobium sp.]